jgi:hypothetical protein
VNRTGSSNQSLIALVEPGSMAGAQKLRLTHTRLNAAEGTDIRQFSMYLFSETEERAIRGQVAGGGIIDMYDAEALVTDLSEIDGDFLASVIGIRIFANWQTPKAFRLEQVRVLTVQPPKTYLSGLELKTTGDVPAELTPAFHRKTNTYDVTLPNGAATLQVKATQEYPDDTDMDVTLNDEAVTLTSGVFSDSFQLEPGENILHFTLTYGLELVEYTLIIQCLPEGYKWDPVEMWGITGTKDANVKNGGPTDLNYRKSVEVVTDPTVEFTRAVKTEILDQTCMDQRNAWWCYDDTTRRLDVTKYVNRLYFSIWIKVSDAPEAPEKRGPIALRLMLFDNYNTGSFVKDVTLDESGKWYYFEFSLTKDMINNGFNTKMMGFLTVRNVYANTDARSIKNGESFEVAQASVYYNTAVPDTRLYSDRVLAYTNPYTSTAEKLASHGTADNVTVTDGVTAAPAEATDGDRYNFARTMTVIGAKENTWSAIYALDKTADLAEYSQTGALQLWLKSTRANARVDVGFVDSAGTVMKTTVMVTEADKWQEFQIRIVQLSKAGFDRGHITGVYVGSEYYAQYPENHLRAGDKVFAAGMGLFSDSPPRLAGSALENSFVDAYDDVNLFPSVGDQDEDGQLYYEWYRDSDNLYDESRTWGLNFYRENYGFSIGLPLDAVINFSDYAPFGLLSFALYGTAYVTVDFTVTDGVVVYTASVGVQKGQWTRYDFSLFEMQKLGMDMAHITAITLQRGRGVVEGSVINFSPLTLYSDRVAGMNLDGGTEEPEEPSEPIDPQDPEDPENPENPVDPADPENPGNPETPGNDQNEGVTYAPDNTVPADDDSGGEDWTYDPEEEPAAVTPKDQFTLENLQTAVAEAGEQVSLKFLSSDDVVFTPEMLSVVKASGKSLKIVIADSLGAMRLTWNFPSITDASVSFDPGLADKTKLETSLLGLTGGSKTAFAFPKHSGALPGQAEIIMGNPAGFRVGDRVILYAVDTANGKLKYLNDQVTVSKDGGYIRFYLSSASDTMLSLYANAEAKSVVEVPTSTVKAGVNGWLFAVIGASALAVALLAVLAALILLGRRRPVAA